MKVYLVGTSCTWFERNNTSFILDDKILFDVPDGAYKLIIRKMNIFDVKSIYISHFHSDHFTDMQVIATRFMRESEKNGVTEKLNIYGPKGTLDHLVEFNKVVFGGCDECSKESLTKRINFIEVEEGDEFEDLGYKVKVFKMDHGKVYCQGYTFTDKNGQTIGFTADTKDCDNLHKMLEVSDVAFVDMAATEPHHSHLDTEAFVQLTQKYKNCKMYPVHTSDSAQEFAEKNGLNAVYDGQELNF
ncbi:MAG: hypothetical protein IJ310_02205 [Clostridia bacterium]|nr:hypothetical protein [Clostridia bacterium]